MRVIAIHSCATLQALPATQQKVGTFDGTQLAGRQQAGRQAGRRQLSSLFAVVV
jgi:hypothetical protein